MRAPQKERCCVTNKYALEAETLKGIEVFATGVHNGDPYDERDLDEMVAAFGRLDFKPPLKSGHSKDEPGMPALGYVANLRREGRKLIADFVDMPKIVYDYIKAKRFNTVSSEVYWNLKRGGGSYRRALKAVALLGAEIPAVAGLRPLHELFSADAEVHNAEAIQLFSSEGENQHGGNTMSDEDTKKLQDELDAANSRAADLEAKAKADAEALAKLQAENKSNADGLASLTKRFEDMSRSNGNLDDVRRNAELTEAKAKAEAADKARIAAEARARAEADAREVAQTELKLNAERIAALEEDGRKRRIDSLVAAVKVPALRKFFAQYADMATRVREGEAKVYVNDLNGGKHEALAELEQAINLVNSDAAKLFTLYSKEDTEKLDGRQHDSPDMEVDRLAKKYQAEHKDVAYSDAMRIVLDANPELKEAYAKRRTAVVN